MTKVAIPTSASELEELLNDGPRVGELIKNNQFGEFVSAYSKTIERTDPDLIQQINEGMQAGLQDFLRRNEQTRPDIPTELIKPGAHVDLRVHPTALGAPLNKEFPGGLREFLTSTMPTNRLTSSDVDRWRRIRNDYSSIDPSKGGFLVPETIRAGLLANALETAIMRPRATVVTMDAPRVVFPAIDETTRSGSVFGGISWAWVAEGAAMPESEARFGRVVLDASKLVTYCEVPSELPLDAPQAFGDVIDQRMPAALAFGQDYAYLVGTGVGQPMGYLNAANKALVSVAKETNQPNDTIVVQNINKMFSRMTPSSLKSAVWVATIDTFPQLAEMSLATGTGGSPVWLNNGVIGAPPMTIYGRPVEFTEKTPTLGDLGDISFVDPAQYLVGDMRQMRVQSSEHYKFNQDLIVYRVIDRGDGRPWMLSAVTPANGSTNTLSPYVTLAAR